MARFHNRLPITLESLEKREVLTAGGPTEQAQYMLEVLNLARTNPVEAADWVRDNVDSTIQANLNYYGVNLDEVTQQIASAKAKQPLAWDESLAAAATIQAEDMAANGFQSHDGSTEANRTIENRLDRAGYGNRVSYGENGFAYTRGSGEKAVANSMQAFLIDWGVSGSPHRKNIQQPDSTASNSASEVGVSITSVTRSDLVAKGFGPTVVTQVFGRPADSKPQIVGVVYADKDDNGRFSYKEGQGDVTVEVTNVATKAVKSLETWDAGGYQVEVDPGTYAVSARTGSRSLGSKTVTVGTENVKVDFNTDRIVNEATPVVAVKSTPIVETPKPFTIKASSTTSSTTASGSRTTLSSDAAATGQNSTSEQRVTAPDKDKTTAVVNFQATSTTKANKPNSSPSTPASAPVSKAAALEAVDQVVSSGGISKDWLSSKVTWGQGWKAKS